MQIEPSILNMLIELGNSDKFDEQSVLDKYYEIKHKDYINRLHWRDWNSVTVELSTEDLIALIKALTACEKNFKSWSAGSVSAVIWTFKELERRDHGLSRTVANWILPRTQNGYVPFGTQNFGAKSIQEYEQRKKQHSERIGKGLEEEASFEKRAAEQREIRRRQREKTARDRNTIARQEFIEKIKDLSIREQLLQIAEDTIYSIGFYPITCADRADQKIIESLDRNIRLKLLEKLKGKQRGPWKRFKKRLLSTFRTGPFNYSTSWDRKPWFRKV